MKKLITYCVLAIGMMADAQTVQTISKPLKLNIVAAGTAADSVLVRGADKIVKFVPRSEFGGGSGADKSFQDILNQPWTNFIHTFSGGLKFENPYASVLAYRDGIIIERTNLTSTPGKAELFSHGIAFTDSSGNRTFTNYPNNGSFDKTFAVSVNGNYADANGNITIAPGGNQNLQSVLENGNEVYLPFFLSVGANKYGVLQDNWNRYSVGVEKDGASLNFGVGSTPQLNYRHKNVDNSLTENSFLFPHNGIDNKTIPISVNGKYADSSTGNIVVSSITTTFTTNDGKTVTVTNGVITNVQ